MKLTWFGGTTIRVHIGGQILVGDADGAPVGSDRAELVSGADQVFAFDGPLNRAEPEWRPRKVSSILDADEAMPDVLVWRLSELVLLIDTVGEPPLVLAVGPIPNLGRWARDMVVVLFGTDIADRGKALLEGVSPQLVVLAGSDETVGEAVAALREHLDGTGLMALEPGMAIEV